MFLSWQTTEHPESRLWYFSTDVSVYQASGNCTRSGRQENIAIFNFQPMAQAGSFERQRVFFKRGQIQLGWVLGGAFSVTSKGGKTIVHVDVEACSSASQQSKDICGTVLFLTKAMAIFRKARCCRLLCFLLSGLHQARREVCPVPHSAGIPSCSEGETRSIIIHRSPTAELKRSNRARR